MAKNSSLGKAKESKMDEFYTQLSDIEYELKHYKEHFKDKVVFCNCDDPYESNFFKYFVMNFNYLGLKKLIATCYVTSPISQTQLSLFYDEPIIKEEGNKKPYKVEITEIGDIYTLEDVEAYLQEHNEVVQLLSGDGDFRSKECVKLLEEADIVVTNPPFSLFREYVTQLMEYEKKFLIIGSWNAITYKEIFPLIKDNKMWLGVPFNRGNAYFAIPNGDTSLYAKGVYNQETGLVKFRNVCWYTNLDIPKRHENLILYRSYNSEQYPTYDNYDAIEVAKTVDIPCDYDGIMGVPITFLDKYNPEQFEIMGISGDLAKSLIIDGKRKSGRFYVNGKRLYDRIAIKRRV